MRARQHRGHHPLADVAVADSLADLPDRARALVTHDVRRRRHHAAGAVEGVTALDADGLDLDQHGARAADRVGHVLVAKDLGGPGLVVDGCLHDAHARMAADAAASVATFASRATRTSRGMRHGRVSNSRATAA